jgi:RNA polymerase-interacting CarD/CdnL/TRCF family regulator
MVARSDTSQKISVRKPEHSANSLEVEEPEITEVEVEIQDHDFTLVKKKRRRARVIRDPRDDINLAYVAAKQAAAKSTDRFWTKPKQNKVLLRKNATLSRLDLESSLNTNTALVMDAKTEEEQKIFTEQAKNAENNLKSFESISTKKKIASVKRDIFNEIRARQKDSTRKEQRVQKTQMWDQMKPVTANTRSGEPTSAAFKVEKILAKIAQNKPLSKYDRRRLDDFKQEIEVKLPEPVVTFVDDNKPKKGYRPTQLTKEARAAKKAAKRERRRTTQIESLLYTAPLEEKENYPERIVVVTPEIEITSPIAVAHKTYAAAKGAVELKHSDVKEEQRQIRSYTVTKRHLSTKIHRLERAIESGKKGDEKDIDELGDLHSKRDNVQHMLDEYLFTLANKITPDTDVIRTESGNLDSLGNLWDEADVDTTDVEIFTVDDLEALSALVSPPLSEHDSEDEPEVWDDDFSDIDFPVRPWSPRTPALERQWSNECFSPADSEIDEIVCEGGYVDTYPYVLYSEHWTNRRVALREDWLAREISFADAHPGYLERVIALDHPVHDIRRNDALERIRYPLRNYVPDDIGNTDDEVIEPMIFGVRRPVPSMSSPESSPRDLDEKVDYPFQEPIIHTESGLLEEKYYMTPEEVNGDVAVKSHLSTIVDILNPFGNHPQMMDTYGPLVVLFMQLSWCKNLTQAYAAVYQYGRIWNLRGGSVLDNEVLDKFVTSWNEVKEEINEDMPILTESWAEDLDTLKTLFNKVLASSVVKVFRDFFVSCASLEMFSKDVSKKVYYYLGKPERMNVLDMINLCFESLSVLVRAGEGISQGLPVHEVLFSKNPVSTFLDSSHKLLYYTDKTYAGLPKDGCLEERDFHRQAIELLVLGENLVKVSNPLTTPMKDLSRMNLLLKQAIFEVVERSYRNKMRIPPVSFIIYGPPGIGKSYLMNHIFKCHADVKGVKYSDDMVYHRNPNAEHWEGLQPISQPYLHISEVGSKSDSLVKVQGDQAVTEVTSVADSQPYAANMAFEGKGKIFIQPEVMCIDTNSPDLGLGILVKNKAAYERRFNYLGPVVKPEFRLLGMPGIDVNKSLLSEIDIMDRWTFNFYKKIPQNNVDSITETILDATDEKADIYELTSVLRNIFTEHIRTQQNFKDRVEEENSFKKYLTRPVVTESGMLDIEVSPAFFEAVEQGRDWFFRLVNIIMMYLLISVLDRYLGLGTVFGKHKYDLFFFGAFMGLAFQIVPLSWLTLTYVVLSLARPLVKRWFLNHLKSRIVSSFNRKRFELTQTLSNWFWATDSSKTYFSWNNVHTIAYVAAITGGIIKLYKMFDKEVIKTQSHSNFTMKTETAEKIQEVEEKLDCGFSYKRVPVHNTKIWNTQVVERDPPVHKSSALTLEQAIAKNVRVCSVKFDKYEVSHVLGVCGNNALINTHMLGPKGEDRIVRISLDGTKTADTPWQSTLICEKNRVDLGNDISVISLQGIQFKDIRKHLSENKNDSAELNAVFQQTKVRALYQNTDRVNLNAYLGEFTTSERFQYVWPDHRPGLCGLPLLGEVAGGSAIIGIHMGGVGMLGVSSVIHASEVLKAILELKWSSPYMPILSESAKLFDEEMEMEDPAPKSAFRYEDLRSLRYYGKEPGNIMAHQKSRLQPTGLNSQVNHLLESVLGVEISKEFGRPVMQAGYRSGKYLSPYNIGLRKLAKEKNTLDPRIMQVVIDRYVDHILEGVEGTKGVSPLTLEAAINGVPKDCYIRRVNTATAAGHGHPGPKSRYLPVVLESLEAVVREPIEDLKKELLDMMECDEDEAITSRYVATLKDEPRSLEKVSQGETRLFYASRISNLIVSRMVLAPFFSLMIEKGEAFGTAVGVNMHAGADSLIRRLHEFSPLLMEGDYGQFDVSQPPDIRLAEATIIYRILRALGYNRRALKITQQVLSGELYPLVTLLKDVFKTVSLQPSGKYGTAEGNSLSGVIMLMYAWYASPSLRDMDFFEFVLPLTYGDDVLASVKEEVQELFNNKTYQEFCRDIYGMAYTSASKSEVIDTFVSIETCSFLKRNFVFDEELSRYVAPLDINSLSKMMSWRIPSAAVSESEQMYQTYISFLWELSLHANEAQFNQINEKLKPVVESKFMCGAFIATPSFAQIQSAMFEENMDCDETDQAEVCA